VANQVENFRAYYYSDVIALAVDYVAVHDRLLAQGALRRRVQIALKPASKGLGLHRIFKRRKGRKYVIADSAFKRVQVDAWACRLDAGEHHLGLALRTGGALKGNRWNGGRQALRLGHDASLE
jgi:hypothetical protein